MKACLNEIKTKCQTIKN